MEKFSAQRFVTIGTLLWRLREEVGMPPTEGDVAFDFRDKSQITIEPERLREILKSLEFMALVSGEAGLRITRTTLDQLGGDLLVRDTWSRQYLIGRIAGIEGALRAEMCESLFLHIPTERQGWYEEPRKEWNEVLERFPRLTSDIEESSKCFACDRYAGAIFHALLIAEFGVIEVAKVFGVEGDKPGWGAMERLERIHAKKYADLSDLEKKHSQFLGHVIPLLSAIKDAWRHKISHVENKLEWMDTVFSPQIAEEIISSTRGFMRRLATDLPR